MPDGCAPDAGRVRPVIDRRRCEGKADCERVCPYGVFALRALDDDERGALPLLAKVKLWVHGGSQAFAVHADACQSCGKCVEACPERAITLVPVSPPRAP